MKSAKDFAEVWKINSVSAGKKLKRLNAVPVSKVGAVLFYSDDTFTELTGVEVKKIDFSNLISSVEIASEFDIKDKSVRNNLRKHNVKVELTDGGIPYYLREKALDCFQKKPKKLKTNISHKSNQEDDDSLRYRISILSKSSNKFLVKYVGLKKQKCLKRMIDLFNEGWDFCIRSYEVVDE